MIQNLQFATKNCLTEDIKLSKVFFIFVRGKKKNCLAYIKNLRMIFSPMVVTGITYWFNTLIQMRNKWKHKNLYLNYEKQKKLFSEVDTNADNFGLSLC